MLNTHLADLIEKMNRQVQALGFDTVEEAIKIVSANHRKDDVRYGHPRSHEHRNGHDVRASIGQPSSLVPNIRRNHGGDRNNEGYDNIQRRLRQHQSSC